MIWCLFINEIRTKQKKTIRKANETNKKIMQTFVYYFDFISKNQSYIYITLIFLFEPIVIQYMFALHIIFFF
jgi:hypothetical protein